MLFISYKHEKGNVELIEKIVKRLKDSKYDVWFDKDKIHTGDSLTLEIEKGIKESNEVICFITNEYIKAKNCLLEFHYASNKDKKCTYILLEPIDRDTANGVNMYLYGDAIRFDAFKHKSQKLDDYVNVIFSEIISSINRNESTIKSTLISRK